MNETAERARTLMDQFKAERRLVIEQVSDKPTMEQARLISHLSIQILTCEMVLGIA